ncbi:tRNA (guanosine(37)-N1)-methyltransferase TrmD [Erysipelothrix urinaevulpis]|uniref:tRNA (guanosine(37)-N1)-methyltransferase TrmD n=1 Tax=Erysipelothrix urinaevulpis TaxID=2683717 RepID=UPI00135C4665|nr:tRNA (guanosine(37)-N1)-methyltransferase TrmD [Erysipelothrix urinaevulpis]
MKISILTLFPDMFTGFIETSIIKKARLKDLVELNIVDMRAFTEDKHNRVDDYPFGGGAGLVLMCQPVLDALKSVRTKDSKVILLSPQGPTLNQAMAYDLSEEKDLVLICGHYEGFDERIRDYIDMELSIGDYVLTGGEVAAMVVSDAIIRLVDGVITQESHEDDSFSNGLLEYPHYTRPRVYEGKEVPEVLLSGHHENIRQFRLEKSLEKTLMNRPDLLEGRDFTKEEQKIMEKLKK